VLAAEGYPGAPRKGDEIRGLDAAATLPLVTVFHAGTRADEHGRVVTAGGRVVSVCGRGGTLAEAVETAYRGVDQISFDGAFCRRDIGADTLRRLEGCGGTT
jgi:phosphoribosylamine--glycine ligase